MGSALLTISLPSQPESGGRRRISRRCQLVSRAGTSRV